MSDVRLVMRSYQHWVLQLCRGLLVLHWRLIVLVPWMWWALMGFPLPLWKMREDARLMRRVHALMGRMSSYRLWMREAMSHGSR